MTQDTSATVAALHASDGQNHFLQSTSPYSAKVYGGGEMGSHGIEHDVIVFDKEGLQEHPVVLCLNLRPFALQEYLTASEARTLAHALLMAASFSERATAALPTAEVAA